MKHSKNTALTRQDQINLEIFHAIEALGERLKSTESIKKDVKTRLEDLESGAEVDEQTGKYYLPLVIDPAQLPNNFNSATNTSSKAVVFSSFVSFFVAIAALTIVLVSQSDNNFSQNTQIASAESLKTASAWQTIDDINKQKEQEKLISLLLERLDKNEQILAELKQRQIYVENQYAKILLSDIDEVASNDAQPSIDNNIDNSKEITNLDKTTSSDNKIAVSSIDKIEKDKNLAKNTKIVVSEKPPVTVNEKQDIAQNATKDTNKPIETVNSKEEKQHLNKNKITLTKLDRVKPDPNLPKDLKELEKKAIAGDPASQHDLGALYASGQIMDVNYKKAAYWFLKAAENGVANAHYNLGVMYHQGMGLKRNVKKALYWYKQAATMGHPEALYNLGIAYIEGIGTAVDTKRGIGYLKRAANAGIAQAAYNLGILYEGHFSDEPNSRSKAIKWYEYAGKMGSDEAIRSAQRLRGNNPMMLAASDDSEKVLDIPKNLNDIETAAGYELPPVAVMEEGSANEDMFDTVKYPVQLVSRIQRILIDMKLLPYQKPTGKMDMKTKDAIRSFQKSNSLEIDGIPSQNLLDMMLSHKK